MTDNLELPADLEAQELRKHLIKKEMSRWRDEEFLRFYEPQPYQLASHNSRAHRRLDHGGVRSGKTMSEIAEIVWRCMGNDFGTGWAKWHPEWIGEIKTPQFWRVCSSGMTESVLKVLVEWFKKLTPRFALEGEKFNYSSLTHRLMFKNNSWVEFMSYDQEEGKGAGRPLHGVLLDESHKAPKAFRLQCLNRLIDYNGHARASCCPEDGITWEYEWYEKAQNGDPDFASFQFPTVENKFMYPEYDLSKPSPAIERIMEDYNHDERLLRVVLYGDFIAIGGLIYETLSADRHRLDAKEAGVQPDWPIFVSIDPGIQKAHAINWAAAGPGGQIHIFREAQVGRGQVTQTMEELAWAIREKSRDQRIAGFIFDPHWDWDNKVAKTESGEPLNLERELRKALDKYGYSEVLLLKTRKDRSKWLGIDQVKKRLVVDQSIDRPLLTISPDCEETWRQMREYSCVPQKKTSPDAHRPRIRNVDDDFCDCVRYILAAEGVSYSDVHDRPHVESHVEFDEFGFFF